VSPGPCPAALARRMLRFILPPESFDHIRDDLAEMFRRTGKQQGWAAARRWYWRWSAGAVLMLLGAALGGSVIQQSVWTPMRGDGTFVNPVIYADYSDPDAVRVGGDYFMVASSFSAVPGLPILHSRDLVNWELVSHALPRLVPEATFSTPQHGAGVWAPSIRHHAGKYWIYYPDPDFGIYAITATDPRGEWSAPVLVKAGRGLIDPCPFWDDDGRVYLIHAFARSRAGFANVLHLDRLSPDGMRVDEPGRIVIDGDTLPGYTTLEGPKLYKRDDWYYVFAPAGGVKTGWQSVFRSRHIDGPFEARIVLAQGSSDVNGPHQGALVDTPKGEWWFLHFQDADAYGRIVHLQPVTWRDGWPVIGADPDGDGKGEPRRSWTRPGLPAWKAIAPPTSDTFDDGRLGLQWQWQANPEPAWWSIDSARHSLRLSSVPGAANLWSAPNLLLQKFPAPEFTVTAALDSGGLLDGERAGLIVFGTDYAWIGVERLNASQRVVMRAVASASTTPQETTSASFPVSQDAVTVRVSVASGGRCVFSYSTDGRTFTTVDPPFTAKPGRWVGAKVGLFASAPSGSAKTGFLRVQSFVVTR
jgi:beta-xylosidase